MKIECSVEEFKKLMQNEILSEEIAEVNTVSIKANDIELIGTVSKKMDD